MQKLNVKVYERDGFLVDIIENEKENTIEFWLYKKNYGYKIMMFGIMKKDLSFDDTKGLVEMIEGNIDDFIPLYNEDMDKIEQKIE